VKKLVGALFVIAAASSPLPAIAWGSDAGGWGGGAGESGGSNGTYGDDGVGGWAIPEILREDAKSLRDQFLSVSPQELLDSQILKTLCEESSCGALDEGQASLILDRMIQARAQIAAEKAAWWNWLNGFIAALTSIGGLFVAAAGLWFSIVSIKTARSAEVRSRANTVEIERLEDVAHSNGGT